MLMVSACLLGVNCKYDGGNNRSEKVLRFLEEEGGGIIPVCPEQLGGLPTPRNPAVLPQGGESVLSGEGKVVMRGWGDVSSKFLRGAEETLKIAEIFGVDKAILKSGSPSCGSEMIRREFGERSCGMGVTTALLRKNGIEVISEKDL